MARIQVAKVPKSETSRDEVLEMLASFCYHYPAYTFAQARKMPAKRVAMMLKVAQREQAKMYYNLTQIAAAPHTKKGAGVKKLADGFKGMMK